MVSIGLRGVDCPPCCPENVVDEARAALKNATGMELIGARHLRHNDRTSPLLEAIAPWA